VTNGYTECDLCLMQYVYIEYYSKYWDNQGKELNCKLQKTNHIYAFFSSYVSFVGVPEVR